MKLLLLHSDYFEYNVKKETKIAEKLDPLENRNKDYLENVLIVFIAVEKDDEKNEKYIIKKTTEEITNILNKINEDKILLYPYAHLSSDLANPKFSLDILIKIENELKKMSNILVRRAPFGWYKSFSIKCKGHPLSELSRHITSIDLIKNSNEKDMEDNNDSEELSEALKQEKSVISHWKIIDIDGSLNNIEEFSFSNHINLKHLVDYEISKNRCCKDSPPHVNLMKKLEIADYEPGSDSGNMRYYPKGRFIKSLLESYIIEETTREYNAMEVETPIMYDMDHPTLKKYLDRFPARQYSINSDKKRLFLRFAACFGQFLINHDMTISYRHLPLKMIELTRYSFRKEQRGELVGLRRLRAFTMPDMHTLTKDMEEAKKEFMNQYLFCIKILNNIGLSIDDFEIAIRFTKDFYENNKEIIDEMVRLINKPVLIEMWDKRFFYFELKFEFNFIDNLYKASALSTVQIDVENAERYDIKYINNDSNSLYPVILHCSPSGAIERCIYAILEKAAFSIKQKQLPVLPLWLSPTQIRLIPVSEKYNKYVEEISKMLYYRTDIDDRELTLSKKIRDANMEWIPYIVVIGENEVLSNKLKVTIRSKSTINKQYSENLTIDELNNIIKNNMENHIYRNLPLNKYLSKRPIFI